MILLTNYSYYLYYEYVHLLGNETNELNDNQHSAIKGN